MRGREERKEGKEQRASALEGQVALNMACVPALCRLLTVFSMACQVCGQ